jgi:hypothetical protein
MQDSLRQSLRELSESAEAYFADVSQLPGMDESHDPAGDIFSGPSFWEPDYFWKQLPKAMQSRALALIDLALPVCASLSDGARASALTGTEDIHDVKVAAKAIRSALRLRKFQYRRADVVHDEGAVLGFQPAEQSESTSVSPSRALDEFRSAVADLNAVLRLIEAAPPARSQEVQSPVAARYRAGTAFIMMWMDPKHPELADVADTVRSVFRSFGIRAVRADDIEHEGAISERVLNEIRTSEFLFADLTGTRPNVYYEVGFAHALDKRVLLFRKSGTEIHFDLAAYNCPEYENLRDLREKLTRRLVGITNRNPTDLREI